ncbi:thioredoxin domain-containing protein [Staphylococcus caprae]|uniref:thioredoxin domain-containing protein n=1 Tax=Staphylococcus caprae TaxID=29380 RepID=UPI001C82DBC3|nr:thioredoxin domain-containing protein [Staphylococcus caprae]MBX5319706.1 thioredoxin domain-containing protein [Staphylococcus caprae]MDI9231166.1 thioredoxin domain-containing protein [Staphylococcus caprae]
MYQFILKRTSMLAIILLLCGCSTFKYGNTKKPQDHTKCVTIYGDYKCAYCKQIEASIVPKLKKDYINKGKAEVKFVNLGFLGKDSMNAGRATHAVKLISDDEYLKLNRLIFKAQPKNSHQTWITKRTVDKQIDKLDLNKYEKNKVKKMYRDKDSKAWKMANDDKKAAKKKDIKKVPLVYINGEKVKNPYKYKEYKKLLDNKQT